jgi:predicted ArsR family transcriptional regulator
VSIEAVALLQDPVRRRLYDLVVAHDHDIGRNEAAEAAGIQRTLAAFHLDKLVEGGLLDAVFRRPEGRSGPGAGRPAKYYRRADAEFAVTIPPRDYRAAAMILAEAAESARLDVEVADVARRRSADLDGRDLSDALRERGYEPYDDDGTVRLRNCPFHLLAEEFPPLVCGMNLALLEGVAAGAGYTARMAPAVGRCCVALSKNSES